MPARKLHVVRPGKRRREQPYVLYEVIARAACEPHAAGELRAGRPAFHHLPHLALIIVAVHLGRQRTRVPGSRAAGCGLALFKSDWKFESGTGWPSFYTAIPGALGTKTDHKVIVPRTEYHCAQCLGHQGHVFEDGPRPTGLRYCNNGVALRFIPKGPTQKPA